MSKPGPPAGPGAEKAASDSSGFQSQMRGMQNQYPVPMKFQETVPFGNQRDEPYTPLPAEYGGSSDATDKFMFKQQLMRNPLFNNLDPSGNARVNYNVDDNDVGVVKSMEERRRLYEYHRWIDHIIDPRKPGNLEWLMRVEPDYIKMKMTALNTHMKLQEKKIRLSAFGVQDQEDLRMKYLIDNDMLQDGREASDANRYIAGFFAPKYNVPVQPSNFTNPFQNALLGSTREGSVFGAGTNRGAPNQGFFNINSMYGAETGQGGGGPTSAFWLNRGASNTQSGNSNMVAPAQLPPAFTGKYEPPTPRPQ